MLHTETVEPSTLDLLKRLQRLPELSNEAVAKPRYSGKAGVPSPAANGSCRGTYAFTPRYDASRGPGGEATNSTTCGDK